MKSNQINIHHKATKLKILHDIAQLSPQCITLKYINPGILLANKNFHR